MWCRRRACDRNGIPRILLCFESLQPIVKCGHGHGRCSGVFDIQNSLQGWPELVPEVRFESGTRCGCRGRGLCVPRHRRSLGDARVSRVLPGLDTFQFAPDFRYTHSHTHTLTHNENRENKNRARKAVKENTHTHTHTSYRKRGLIVSRTVGYGAACYKEAKSALRACVPACLISGTHTHTHTHTQ